MESLEDLASSLSARSTKITRRKRKPESRAQESRAIANRAILEHTSTNSTPISFSSLKPVCQISLTVQEETFEVLSINSTLFQLQASRYDTIEKDCYAWNFVKWKALSWYNPYLEKPHYFGTIFQLGQGSKRSFVLPSAKINQEQVSEARLPVEIKDALVHFDNPASVSAAMDLAIRIDNRLFERRQEQRLFHQGPSSSYSSATPITPRFRHQQQQQRIFEPKQSANPNRFTLSINLPSARPTPKSRDEMDIDFVHRGPLSSWNETPNKQGLCLVCAKLDIEK
ncbi:hypothetical protein BASA84_001141 [Batrachochytrium salamandrivorans]|nr:hypothetical protein BASA84_001141 [Batrachochytrium salamandrivorans]